MKSLKDELKDLNECMNRKTVLDLIYKIVFLPNIKKYKGFSYLFESFEDSDEWVKEELLDNQITVRCLRSKKKVSYHPTKKFRRAGQRHSA